MQRAKRDTSLQQSSLASASNKRQFLDIASPKPFEKWSCVEPLIKALKLVSSHKERHMRCQSLQYSQALRFQFLSFIDHNYGKALRDPFGNQWLFQKLSASVASLVKVFCLQLFGACHGTPSLKN
ncbi:hypothetical protein HY17_16560 [Hyphomonas sp. CY54-11-8]|nr:hypothetical protein HY17_16560 [Hyphomonas sp. CY54-11-8]